MHCNLRPPDPTLRQLFFALITTFYQVSSWSIYSFLTYNFFYCRYLKLRFYLLIFLLISLKFGTWVRYGYAEDV